MTTDEWLKLTLDGAPPLTDAQVHALRPIFAPVIPHINAAPAANDEGRARTPQDRSRKGI